MKLQHPHPYGKQFIELFTVYIFELSIYINLKCCDRYIFVSLFFKSKRQNLWNKEKCFLFHFKISFGSWENQILEF